MITKTKGWVYVSFASPTIGFLGVAIVRGGDQESAVDECKRLGILPRPPPDSGPYQAVGALYPPEVSLPSKHFRNRLLSEDEAKAIYPDAQSLAEWEAS